jgi:hypothetical protein
MPFAEDFDDVYSAIKMGVENATATDAARCFRLDEKRPAGRITERLVNELRSASFCVADLTGCRPNVMWEVGYAMALGLPVIFVTQRVAELPFDIRDMQTVGYDRGRLAATLSQPLKRMVIDTVSDLESGRSRTDQDSSGEFVGQLLEQMVELKAIVAQAVHSWHPDSASPVQESATALPPPKELEGAWFNEESKSHIYARIVDRDLIAPYCYGGDEKLTGVYYGFRRTGEYWFARFAWVNREYFGFAFMKQQAVDLVVGTWWLEMSGEEPPNTPPEKSGEPLTLRRIPARAFPGWADGFLRDVEKRGLTVSLSKH